MSQLTIQTQTSGSVTVPGARRRRPMRSERMVGLRSAMPLGLVTLRHDIPELKTTTPKVDSPVRTERADAETPARKGGEAQW
jgi:hypothetical protein